MSLQRIGEEVVPDHKDQNVEGKTSQGFQELEMEYDNIPNCLLNVR